MSLNLSKEIIEEIRERCDIAEVISGCGVQLKRSGAGSFIGLCPFHQEKTPSFTVNPAKRMFYCFGCGKGGDVFRFFMDHQNLDFVNAAKILADRCGVVIPEESERDAAASQARAGARERLYAINEEFSRFFCRYLADNPHSPGGEYLARRGIPMEVAQKFRIGLAPAGNTVCRDYGRHLGFSEEELVTSGVLQRFEDTGKTYEPFQGRLTFTIENEQGKAVGFSARTLEAHPDRRKYVNTPETPVFHKGSLIYALPFARQGIGRAKKAVICEGQLDAIAFHRAGFDFAVAPLGTAFTAEQAKILRRYTGHIVLAFDADNAGQNAVLKAAKLLLPLSMELKVLRIPGGKDPDELYAHGGAEALGSALESAIPWMDVLKENLPGRFDMTSPVGRGEAAAFVAEFLHLVPNRVELEVYVSTGAAMLGISEAALWEQLEKLSLSERRRQEFAKPAPRMQSVQQKNPQLPTKAALSTLLTLALASEDIARKLSEELPAEELAGENASPAEQALNLVINAALNGEFEQTSSMLQDFLLEHPSPEVSRILAAPVSYSSPERALSDALDELRRMRGLARRQKLLAALAANASPEERMKLLAQIGGLS